MAFIFVHLPAEAPAFYLVTPAHDGDGAFAGPVALLWFPRRFNGEA